MQFLRAVLDFVFPPRCESCSALGPDPLCSSCHSQISYLKPTAFIHSVALYENPLKKAIMKFKYKRKTRLSKPLGTLLAQYAKHMFDINRIDFLMPVPLHPKRLEGRGFNQSELLAYEISRFFGIPTVTGLLHRVRETKPQFELPKKERIKNVRGAFAVTGAHHIQGKNIMLIDDIFTTGATISECTKVLKEANANQVHVLTLSRAVNL